MQLPNAPFYRRWSVLLAGVIVLAAVGALLGWRGLQQADGADPTTTVPSTTVVATTTTAPPTSVEPTSRPDNVIWEQEGSDVEQSPTLEAPVAWRIVWEYDCSGFGPGGGNFKITGSGAFNRVDIQATEVTASGRMSYSRAGYGHLLVESVCDHWKVTVLAD